MSRCFIVLGGHRCATSAVAGLLHRLGIPAALSESPEDLLQGRPDNPRGHFEDRRFLRLHQRMLAGDHWHNPAPEWFQMSDEIFAQYQRHIEARAAHADLWCVKDPRLCILLPVLLRGLAAADVAVSVVAVRRDSLSVARSLVSRNRFTTATARAIAFRYEGAFFAQRFRLMLDAVPTLDVTAESLRRSPCAVVREIANFAGVPLPSCILHFVEDSYPS